MNDFKEACAIQAMSDLLRLNSAGISGHEIQALARSAFEIADAMTIERDQRTRAVSGRGDESQPNMRKVEPEDLKLNGMYWIAGENGDLMSGRWVKLLHIALGNYPEADILLVEKSKRFGGTLWVNLGDLYVLDGLKNRS